MLIKLSTGKSFEVNAIALYSRKNQVLIDINDSRSFREIAKDFDGIETITRVIADDCSAYEKYEGYTTLFSITKTDSGHVRIMLARG